MCLTRASFCNCVVLFGRVFGTLIGARCRSILLLVTVVTVLLVVLKYRLVSWVNASREHKYNSSMNFPHIYTDHLPPIVNLTIVENKCPPIDMLYPTPTDKLWTYVTGNTFARRSAHYDDRKSLFEQPVLLAFVFRDEALEKGPLPDVYAKVVYSNGVEKCLSQKAVWEVRSKSKYTQNQPHLGYGYVLTIEGLPFPFERPNCLFLSTDEYCLRPSSYINVYWNRPRTKLDFAICLHQPLFKISDHQHVAAWIEMNRSLGAQLITLYYQENNTDQVISTIQKYVNEGFVIAISWHQNITTENDRNYGQQILDMDCLYRNMHVTKYLAFHDLDELLVPHQSVTWHGLVKQLDRPKRSCFQFCMSYFHDVNTVVPMDTNQSGRGCSNVTDIPVMFKRTQRTADISCELFRWKNICKPEAVHIVKIHLAETVNGYDQPTIVPPSIGIIHHYRVVDQRKDEWSVEDLTVGKYLTEVMDNLIARFC